MSDKDLTVGQEVKPKRGRPSKKKEVEEVVVDIVEGGIVEPVTVQLSVDATPEEVVIPEEDAPESDEVKIKETGKSDKPKEVTPCDSCDYTYGSMQCKHGCIHYKRK